MKMIGLTSAERIYIYGYSKASVYKAKFFRRGVAGEVFAYFSQSKYLPEEQIFQERLRIPT